MATLAGRAPIPPENHFIKEKTLPVIEKIPILNNLVKDEDLGFLQEASFDPVKLQVAVDLLTSPHSKLLKKRHFNVLGKITVIYSYGFPLNDLVNVLTILNACAELVIEDEEYVHYMCALIQLLQQPFIMRHSSDEVTLADVASDTLAQLGYLLRVDQSDVRLSIIETIQCMYTGASKVKPTQETKRVSHNFLRKTLEKSGITETVVKALALVDPNNSTLKHAIFEFLRVTSHSHVNCNHMLKAGAGYILCITIQQADTDKKQIQQSTEILWNLIENGNSGEVLLQLSNLQCLQALHGLLLQEISQGHSLYHRTIRNDVLAIITLIARDIPHAPLIEAGLVKSCLLMFTCNETKNKNALVRHLRFTNSVEDFELKKLLLSVILCYSKNISTLNLIRETKLISALFYYLKPIRKIQSNFDSAQLEEIQLQAISSLCFLTPQFEELTKSPEYSRLIMEFFNWCIDTQEDPYMSQGNSFFSAGGRNTKYSQLRYTLRFIRCVVTAENENTVMVLLESELVMKLMVLLNDLITLMETRKTNLNPITDKEDQEETLRLELVCEVLFVLSIFCENQPAHKELVSIDGIKLLVKTLNIDEENVCRGLGYNKLLLAVTEAIWCCIVGNSENERFFLEQSGLFALLDILTVCPKFMQPIMVSCLLDFMENPVSIPHVLTWESKYQVRAPKLMINIWKETELDLKVARSDCGIIEDEENPLGFNFADKTHNSPVVNKTRSIAEAAENMRGKIYGFFLKINYDDLEGLQPSDYIWLSIIEKYLDFKSAEVWKELSLELEEADIRPTTPDLEVAEAIGRISVERCRSVIGQQKELQDTIQSQEQTDEQMFYGQIRETMKQQEKLIKDFNRYIERTSKYEKLKESKQEQKASIEGSRSQEGGYAEEDNYHVTMIMGSLNTTVFCGKQVTADHVAFAPAEAKPLPTATSSRREARFSADY